MSRWGELIPHSEDDDGCLCGCQDNPPVQCWHYEPDTPCDWDVCRQPERLAAGDHGVDPATTPPLGPALRQRAISEHCRPGRCLGLTCCSYECSQGRCPSIPEQFRKPTP